ncbi:MAG: phospholipid carrier-dependent glycosyltransferase [bacterium]|nr:phospholipid carrier-dependent glycosyltransferase [bacterium]
MKKYRKNIYLLLILFVLSIATRFIFFGYPKEVVFDETYFGKFASSYLTGNYYFDLHPPLGKLLISGMGYTAGAKTDSTDYSKINNPYKDDIYIWYRLLPTIAGILLPLIIFFIILQLGVSSLGAFVTSALIIFENSLVVQARFISLDSILLFFGFSALLLYLLYSKSNDEKKKVYLVLSAIFASLAFCIKWTGLSFLGLILFMELYEIFRNRLSGILSKTKSLIKYAKIVTLFFIIGFAIYFSSFVIHFALLPKTGLGDVFMSESFQKTLVGSKYENNQDIKVPNLPEKFFELNKEMYAVNARMDAEHSYSSLWYTWPFMYRPVFYWQGIIDDESLSRPYIYYLGNPIIYWLSIGAIILLVLLSRFFKDSRKTALFIIAGFCINFLPFIFIGRVMFLYHYATALIFAVMALVLIIDRISVRRTKYVLFGALLILSVASFTFFSPLTYGRPLTDSQLAHRIWFPSWR